MARVYNGVRVKWRDSGGYWHDGTVKKLYERPAGSVLVREHGVTTKQMFVTFDDDELEAITLDDLYDESPVTWNRRQ